MAQPLRRFLALLAACGVLCPAAAAAQARERVAFVAVLDRATGQPRSELSPADIEVREDGVRREVLRVSRASGPMPIALLIDNSAAAEPAIPDIRAAVTTFLAGLGDVGPVAILTMAERPTQVVDYTTDPARLSAAVGRLFPRPGSGVTSLDAVFDAANGLTRRESERAAIVVLSALGAEHSNLHYTRALGRLKQSGAALHAAILNPPGRTAFTDAARQRDSLFDRGIRETGGLRRDVLSSLGFRDALGDIAGVIAHQFRVVYARPQTLIPPDTIEVAAAQPGLVAYGTAARGQTP